MCAIKVEMPRLATVPVQDSTGHTCASSNALKWQVGNMSFGRIVERQLRNTLKALEHQIQTKGLFFLSDTITTSTTTTTTTTTTTVTTTSTTVITTTTTTVATTTPSVCGIETDTGYRGNDVNSGHYDKQPDAESCRFFCESSNFEHKPSFFGWVGSSTHTPSNERNECWCKTALDPTSQYHKIDVFSGPIKCPTTRTTTSTTSTTVTTTTTTIPTDCQLEWHSVWGGVLDGTPALSNESQPDASSCQAFCEPISTYFVFTPPNPHGWHWFDEYGNEDLSDEYNDYEIDWWCWCTDVDSPKSEVRGALSATTICVPGKTNNVPIKIIAMCYFWELIRSLQAVIADIVLEYPNFSYCFLTYDILRLFP